MSGIVCVSLSKTTKLLESSESYIKTACNIQEISSALRVYVITLLFFAYFEPFCLSVPIKYFKALSNLK